MGKVDSGETRNKLMRILTILLVYSKYVEGRRNGCPFERRYVWVIGDGDGGRTDTDPDTGGKSGGSRYA